MHLLLRSAPGSGFRGELTQQMSSERLEEIWTCRPELAFHPSEATARASISYQNHGSRCLMQLEYQIPQLGSSDIGN